MNCITGWLIKDILGWWLLHLYIFGGIRVAGDLKIISFHLSIYCLHQLLHTGGVFFISRIGLTLNWKGGGEEQGKGFALGSSAGNPWALPLLEGLPTTPP